MKKSIAYLLSTVFLACDLAPEFEPPTSKIMDSPPESNTTLTAVAERVAQSETGFVLFNTDETDLWVEGVVSSSDAGGNFYKELFLQDSPENPITGLRLLLDEQKLHATFPIGQKLRIKLNGLGAGIFRGILSLGSYQPDGVAPLETYRMDQHLIRVDEISTIVPKDLSLSELSPRKLGKWIRVHSIQFDRSEVGHTFSGEAFDRFDGERRLVDCDDQLSLWLSTSTYAAFTSVIIPESSGEVQGVLSRDYYDEKYILKVNSPTDINFSESRCDPYYQESFEGYPLGKFQGEGWENRALVGSTYWKVYKDEEALGQSIQISAYRSNDEATETWLISPPIPIPEEGSAYLAFRTSVRRADKSRLYAWICEAHEDPENRVWIPLEAALADGADDPLYWIDSGKLPLSDFQGASIQLGFQYLGSGKSTYDGTYELDDIRVIVNE